MNDESQRDRSEIITSRRDLLTGGAAVAGIGALNFLEGPANAAATKRQLKVPNEGDGRPTNSIRISFAGGNSCDWRVLRATTLIGEGMPPIRGLTMQVNAVPAVPNAVWTLDGVISNLRYTNGQELSELRRIQSPLARPEATYASLIPIRKTKAWWDLPQDERRAIFEERSHHTATGLQFLPQIARRLHHSHDIDQPFDFLTWFEYAPEHESLFDALLVELRATEEWSYVDREIDIRLVLNSRKS